MVVLLGHWRFSSHGQTDDGMTVLGKAVRICQRHGHGEDAKTVPLDFHFEKGDGPIRNPGRFHREQEFNHPSNWLALENGS